MPQGEEAEVQMNAQVPEKEPHIPRCRKRQDDDHYIPDPASTDRTIRALHRESIKD